MRRKPHVSMIDPTEPHDVGRFQTTHWSVVLAAGSQSSDGSRIALCQLCDKYWYPLYCYAHSRTGNADAAQDLTQSFFAQLLEKHTIAAADPARGRFRTFLITAFRHFMANEWNKDRAQKRGGATQPRPWDFGSAEDRYRREPEHRLTAEVIFDRRWAIAILNQALARVRADYERDNRLDVFEQLRQGLTVDGDLPRYEEVAGSLGISPGAVKVAVHRLRRRFRESLRNEIRETMGNAHDVDDEIERLFRTFAANR